MEKATPLVAIITAVYNTALYLPEFIESILRNEYQNFDLYLINDGSTDNSAEILESFKEKDSRIHVLHKKNGGVSSARNMGLDLAASSGKAYDFVYFCDSDDIVESNALSLVIEAVQRTNADYGLFSVARFTTKGRYSAKIKIKTETLMTHEDIVKQYFRFGWKWRKEPCSEAFLNNKLFRAEHAFLYRFDTSLKRAEDFSYFLDILPHLKKGVLVPNAWFFWRKRKSSLTNSCFENADLQVCSRIYPDLDARSNTEQRAVQHRLLRALYLGICHEYSNGNHDKVTALLTQYKRLKLKYPIMSTDVKMLLVLSLPRSMLELFLSKRNKGNEKNRAKNEHFFE